MHGASAALRCQPAPSRYTIPNTALHHTQHGVRSGPWPASTLRAQSTLGVTPCLPAAAHYGGGSGRGEGRGRGRGGRGGDRERGERGDRERSYSRSSRAASEASSAYGGYGMYGMPSIFYPPAAYGVSPSMVGMAGMAGSTPVAKLQVRPGLLRASLAAHRESSSSSKCLCSFREEALPSRKTHCSQ